MFIVPVILAGGTGSRLWPLSRSTYPKQLLQLIGHKTMLQETVLRTLNVANIAPPIVICNQEHRFLVEEQLKEIQINNATIILEPFGKNTAPAAAIAAFYTHRLQKDSILLILPADHVIKDNNLFQHALQKAMTLAIKNKLVTFGVKPLTPETGYGYIKIGKPFADSQAFIVEKFIEKPDIEMAAKYCATGKHFWNSGMFVFKASTFLEELKTHASEIYHSCEETIKTIKHDLSFLRLNEKAFLLCPNDSIDYAVMEKTQAAVLVPFDAGWSDVGSWSALWEAHEPDLQGNVIFGDVITANVSNSYLRAESRMLSVLGVEDHIVIETADAVLVAHKKNSQAVKGLVEDLKLKKRAETDLHRYVYRPWGKYETIDKGKNFQVKRITVKPGASLSLQMHFHRSEHWVVVSGHAEVTRGDEVFIVKANESTYIPCGVKHRLANVGYESLEMIEVQSGDYLSEDDIVRFEDNYGRSCAV